MTVEISYFDERATNGLQVAANPTTSQSVTISSTATLSDATPDGKTAVSLIGTEAFRYAYTGPASSVSATGHYVAAGERMWLTPRSGWKFSLRTA